MNNTRSWHWFQEQMLGLRESELQAPAWVVYLESIMTWRQKM